jgi:hypothetical protein
MTTLHALFASIMSLWVSLTGGHSALLVQIPTAKVESVIVASTTTTSVIQEVSFSTTSTSSLKVNDTLDLNKKCTVVKLNYAGHYETYSHCGDLLGYYLGGDRVTFIRKQNTNDSQGFVITYKNLDVTGVSEQSILNTKISSCYTLYLKYKNNTETEDTYCGELPTSYFVTGQALYYRPNEDDGDQKVLKVSDLATTTEIKVLHDSFYEDKTFIILNNKVVSNGKVLSNLDPKTIKVLSGAADIVFYYKDANNVFYKDKIIPEADPESFTGNLFKAEDPLKDGGFGEYYGRDKNHVYYEGKVIIGADPSSFISMYNNAYEGPQGQPFGKDDKQVYYATSTVLKADVSTFKELDWCAFADKNYVFKSGEVIFGADPKTYKCPDYAM